jgi:4-amino-4-deoxy-L-arabinose transferase-like glycosyltransferase
MLSGWKSFRLRRIPAPLVALLVAATACAITWCIVLPPLQGPDEISHFTYTQWIVEHGEIPWEPGREAIPPQIRPYSTEIAIALDETGFGQLQGQASARPWWSPIDERFWANAERGISDKQRRDEIGRTTSFLNGPVYYLYAVIPYEIARGGTFFDRLMAMRLANIPLLLGTLVFVWLVAGQLVGRGWPQVVATGFAACIPQLMNITATVNPDVLIAGEWAAALYVMLLILRRGPRPQLVAVLGLLCLLGVATHVRNLPMLVPAAIAVTLVLARERGWTEVTRVRLCGALVAIISAGVLIGSTSGKGNLRQFGSYIWQFYLPRLPFMNPDPIGPPHHGFLRAYVDQLFGKLALLEVLPPNGVKRALQLFVLASLVAFGVVLVIRRDALRRRADEVALLAMAVFTLLAFLHLSAYRSMALRNPGDPQITGRYILPLLALIGSAYALMALALPRRLAAVFAGLLLAGGVAVQLDSIRLLLERFYA